MKGSFTLVLIIPLFSWLIQEVFIKKEEKMLEDRFDEDYRKYKATPQTLDITHDSN